MLVGVCRLCLETKLLRKSHFIPAALYHKHRKPSYATRKLSGPLDSKAKHIRAHLLCADCEQRFEQGGESEVLHWVNPKGSFRLHERLSIALPRDYNPFDSTNPSIDTRARMSELIWTSSPISLSVSCGAAQCTIGSCPTEPCDLRMPWADSLSRCVCICWGERLYLPILP